MKDIVIIGGGLIGLACARELAMTGRSVVVFDPAPERAASNVAAGMLSPWAEPVDDPEVLQMRERALSLYPDWVGSLEGETGFRPDFARSGTVYLGEMPEPHREVPGAHALSPAELREATPGLVAERAAEGGVAIDGEGYVDPRTLMEALRASCLRLGVRFRREAVLDLLVDWDDRAVAHERRNRASGSGAVRGSIRGIVRGIVIPSGEIKTATVVNAAGAWAGRWILNDASATDRVAAPLSSDAGVIRPMRGELVVLAPYVGTSSSVRMSNVPFASRPVIQSRSGYLVPRRDGSFVAGGTTADTGFNADASAAGVQSILAWAGATFPLLREWRVQEIRAGLRPYRAQGPLIGRDSRRAGLIHATGLNRHGILLAPHVAGRVLQEID
jgi:thiazole synthase